MRSTPLRIIVGLIVFLAAGLGLFASSYLTLEHSLKVHAPTTQPSSAPAPTPPPTSAGAAAGKAASAPASAPAEHGFLADICTSFANSNCEVVNESKWGRFPFGSAPGTPGVATSELGMVYFIFVVWWLLLIGSTTPSRWFVHFLFVLVTAAGLGASGFFDYVMWTHLPKWCPYCLTAHVSSLVIFIGAVLLWPRSPRLAPVCADASSPDLPPTDGGQQPALSLPAEVKQRPWPTFHAFVVTLLAFVLTVALQHAIWLTVNAKARTASAEKELKTVKDGSCRTEKWLSDYWQKQFSRYDDVWQLAYMSWYYEPAIPVKTEDEPFRGPANAPHTIVLFSDLQCPACGRFEDILQQTLLPLAQRYGGVKVIFKHYPICLDCNKYAGNRMHPQACLAAMAVEAGRILGGAEGFWKMHDWIAERRGEMIGADKTWFVKQGKLAGFSADAFEKAMDSKEAMARIQAHIEESQQLGKGYVQDAKLGDYKVTGTPTVIVDNRILRTTRHSKTWQEIFSKPAPPPPADVNRPRTQNPAAFSPAVSLGSQSPATSRPADRSRVIFSPEPTPSRSR